MANWMSLVDSSRFHLLLIMLELKIVLQSLPTLMMMRVVSCIAGPFGVPMLNGQAPQQTISLPTNGQAAYPIPNLPMPIMATAPVVDPIGQPNKCLLLKNMFDASIEAEPDFDLDIKEDEEEECSKYARVKHIYVDNFKELAGSRPLTELRTAEASAVVVEGAASEARAQTTEEDAHPDSGEKSPRTVSAGIIKAEELKKYSNKVT